jgi:RNA polymerase sigma-70 factor (ECF subfamily)
VWSLIHLADAAEATVAAIGLGSVPALARTLRGRSRVARTLINSLLSARVPGVTLRRVRVNGGPGAVYLDAQQRLVAVVALDIAGAQIASINSIVNPDKLTHLGAVDDFRLLLESAR